jgi:hypothetical protein
VAGLARVGVKTRRARGDFLAAGGAVVHRRVFESFGEVYAENTATEETRQLFAGKEHSPAAELYDFS